MKPEQPAAASSTFKSVKDVVASAKTRMDKAVMDLQHELRGSIVGETEDLAQDDHHHRHGRHGVIPHHDVPGTLGQRGRRRVGLGLLAESKWGGLGHPTIPRRRGRSRSP